ncbi:MAG: hypothetical protein B6D57_04425 [Candidatus Coatesbacteria bacterium 4484_99]|uniref:Glycosyl transferase family 1 domain-containing protein n=1 Tax=Candidatus Coatesbacteria bacterium 4484_99 TaxID=1970774 RepID=A0A1W9S1M2_9BACT|nr:MAG: hypothetical protein B6D57_04425 [Candidatus Coatesbacteria bacterium 4484_99]RLC40958.1 MAG: hypothetical protein DRH49_06240 [Candidatus Coatesbacteria bacterium]RLC44490.1 MAG: hypothetical protein DRH44_02140 [Candidatus Coatesbacteria bacterium]
MGERKDRLRVLYIDTTSEVWGGQRSLLELIEILSGEVNPTVAVPEKSRYHQVITEKGIQALTIPVSTRHRHQRGRLSNLISAVRALYRLPRLIADVKPDLIHTNNFLAWLLASVTYPLHRRPIVAHQRDETYHPIFHHLTTRVAHRIIAISPAVAEILPDVALYKTAVIPNPLMVERVENKSKSPHELLATVRKTERPRIGYIGTTSQQKGLHILIDAFIPLVRRHRHANLIVIGDAYQKEDASYLKEQKRKVKEAGVDERVQFLGYQDNPYPLMREMDIIVVPSLSEGQGRVVLEAMALGIPVVASMAGGLKMLYKMGAPCVFFETGDIRALGGKLLAITKDRDKRRKMANDGRNFVLYNFSPEDVFNEILSIYRNTISNQPI